MSQFIGVDLAWGEGKPSRPANESGLALIDESGIVLFAGWARGIDEVADWLIRVAEPGALIAIDAPLVIPNATGMRLAEREVGMGYGRWHVAANASNAAMGWKGGVTLYNRLIAEGFIYTDGTGPRDPSAIAFFECYPYTTIVGMEELGYEDKRPRYKRLNKALGAGEGREARRLACDDLLRRLDGLSAATPPLALSSHPTSAELLSTPTPIDDVPYKHREDLIDALICAWTASVWQRHGESRVQILGLTDQLDPSGHRGVIVAPARPEQRVEGRLARPLRAARTADIPLSIGRRVRDLTEHFERIGRVTDAELLELTDSFEGLLAEYNRLGGKSPSRHVQP
jgi:predicted RNase H-like nuclease